MGGQQPSDLTSPILTRRQVLLGAVAGAGLVVVTGYRPNEGSAIAEPLNGARALGLPRGAGLIRGVTRSGPLQVPPGRTLRFDPSADTTLEMSGNLVVRGRLEMRPRPGVRHVLRFVDVDESAFRGGGRDPLDTDVGLWVIGRGVLDARGERKQGWNRRGTHPTWARSDELVVAPTDPGDFGIGGFGTFRMGSRVPRAHARVPKAEVLNLTRNCVIEGTPGGRSHIFIRSREPQVIRNALIRHMGPRKGGEKVTGRWPLHFHHSGRGLRGTVVQNVVVRDSGSHAFVAHKSHGVTFRRCIAYDVQEDAYWWDPPDPALPKDEPLDSFTNETHYLSCVAALVKPGDDPNGHRLAGFNLSQGTRRRSNVARGCVAVGVQGGANPSGFHWPEGQQGPEWIFEDNVGHNNVGHGLFTWWNTPRNRNHRIRRFTGYANGKAGIASGAYEGSWTYVDPMLVANGEAGVLQFARSQDGGGAPILYRRPIVVGSPVAFKEADINFPGNPPVRIAEPTVIDCPQVVDDSTDPSTTFEFV